MVVYTPAVPQEHGEYRYFADHGFRIEKRSQMLGHLAEGKYVMAVAGTHGKTTTSTLVAWLNRALTGGGRPFWAVSRRISAATWCWATAGDWLSRPTSSTVRSCGSIPMWRWSRRPTPTTSTFTGRTRR